MNNRKSLPMILLIIFFFGETLTKTTIDENAIAQSNKDNQLNSKIASQIKGLEKSEEFNDSQAFKNSVIHPDNAQNLEGSQLRQSNNLANLLKKPAKIQDSENPKDEDKMDIGWIPKAEPDKLIAFGIYIFLALTGIYVSLFGFRVFRLLMIILGFYVSYYGILFALTELKVYKANDISHQMGLFFGCIILGFIISIMCYMLDKINFVIFGMAIASVISLFAAQFFIDFKLQEDRILLLIIYSASTVIFSTLAFLVLDHFIIWGSAFVGSVITPINVGVIFGDFKSFEDRQKILADNWRDFQVYLLVCGLMFITGLGVQYYLRRRIIKRMRDSTLDEIRGTSFLN